MKKNIILVFFVIRLSAIYGMHQSHFDFYPEYPQVRGDEALYALLDHINWEDEPSFIVHAHALLEITGLSTSGEYRQYEAMTRLLHTTYYGRLLINNPDRTDPLQSTLIHKATRLGNIPLCQLLLANGATISSVDILWRTPLHYAVISRNISLLEFFADFLTAPRYWHAINIQDNCKRTALHYAYEYGLSSVVSILLEKGARNDILDWQGNIPSACASTGMHEDPLGECINLLQSTHI